MRVRGESRLKVAAAGILAVLALVLMGRFITGLIVPAESFSQGGQGRRAGTDSGSGKNATSLVAFDPTLRSDYLTLSEGVQYEGTGRNIFRMEDASLRTPPPPAPEQGSSPPVRQGRTSLLPARVRFFGFASTQGDSERIFLSIDDELFIAREGKIVNRRYRILRVTPISVDLEDLVDGARLRLLLDLGERLPG